MSFYFDKTNIFPLLFLTQYINVWRDIWNGEEKKRIQNEIFLKRKKFINKRKNLTIVSVLIFQFPTWLFETKFKILWLPSIYYVLKSNVNLHKNVTCCNKQLPKLFPAIANGLRFIMSPIEFQCIRPPANLLTMSFCRQYKWHNARITTFRAVCHWYWLA